MNQREFYIELGERLRARRLELGMYQSDVGRQLGVSRTMVAHFEIGRQNMSAFRLAQLVTMLGVDLPDADPEPETVEECCEGALLGNEGEHSPHCQFRLPAAGG